MHAPTTLKQLPEPVASKQAQLASSKSPTQQVCNGLLACTESQLAKIDPVEINLLAAKEIPALSELDVGDHQRTVDCVAATIQRDLPKFEQQFHTNPQHWDHDLSLFRLGFMCFVIDEQLGIRYHPEHRGQQAVLYTDAADLFLNGVLESRQGTCANLAVLHVALAWRLGWPVSLACVGSHQIARYDDGKVTHNIETTRTGEGGFHSPSDDHYLKSYGLPDKAVECGSDLRALTSREMLGVFIGFRARHFQDTGRQELAEQDYLLARALFPRSRYLHFAQLTLSISSGAYLFEPSERGHPAEVARWMQDVARAAAWHQETYKYQEKPDAYVGTSTGS